MLILGIETSCDETSAAVVEDGRRILSNVGFVAGCRARALRWGGARDRLSAASREPVTGGAASAERGPRGARGHRGGWR